MFETCSCHTMFLVIDHLSIEFEVQMLSARDK